MSRCHQESKEQFFFKVKAKKGIWQMAHPPSVFTVAARPRGHKAMTGSPVRTPWLLGLEGRAVFYHLGFALKHPLDPLHPWDVRMGSEGQH